MKTLVIIPAYNEQDAIVNLVKDVTSYGYDYLVINDCSTDNTEELLLKNNIKHLCLPINLGIAGVTQVGFKYAKDNDYDCVINIDGDGQHLPKYVKSLIDEIENGNDYVVGSRFESILDKITGTVIIKKETEEPEEPKDDTYTVTFNSNGGSTSTRTKEVTYNNEYGELPVAKKTGYTFIGWYNQISGGTLVNSKTIVSKECDHTLYAHWIANIYKITFEANEGLLETTTKNVTYDETYGELPIPTKENNIFVGWYTALEGGTKINENTKVNILSNQTLYANWTEDDYTYEFKFGDRQEFVEQEVEEYVVSIDGDNKLFTELIISDLKLIQNIDYTITRGSTIVTFLEEGIKKLNTLPVGTYEVIAKYSDISREAIGTIIILEQEKKEENNKTNENIINNPNTGDEIIISIISASISVVAIIICVVALKKNKKEDATKNG